MNKIYLTIHIESKTATLFGVDKDFNISFDTQDALLNPKKQKLPYIISGEDKEAYITAILAGFEETGFRFIKEL